MNKISTKNIALFGYFRCESAKFVIAVVFSVAYWYMYFYSLRMSLCRDIRHFSFTVLAIYSQQDNGTSYTGFCGYQAIKRALNMAHQR